MQSLKSFVVKLFCFVKQVLSSYLKFSFALVIICCVVGSIINFLYLKDLLGPDCRYYGDTVRNCVFMGKNIDSISEIFLTAWALPLIGPIAAVMTPPIVGLTFSVLLWPIYFVFKWLAKTIIKKRHTSQHDA